MKYTAQFKTINDELKIVNIITNNDITETTEIVLSGDNPVIIEVNSDETFAPIKSRSCTISIVTESFYFDMYNSTAQGTRVEITGSNGMYDFIGYVTPNVYNQDYKHLETVEIEAVEALSTLEYYEYEKLNDNGIVSFKNVILSCLKKCNAYQYLYYPDNLHIEESEKGSLLDKLFISELNFFDDDEARTAWKMNTVIEEMMRYLGWTCTIYRNDVYFIDKSTNKYNMVLIETGDSEDVTITHNYNITANSYRGSDANLSLGETYNQIAINCNLYEIKDIIPDVFGDDLVNIVGDGIDTPNYIEKEIDNKYVYLDKYYVNKRYDQYFYNNNLEEINVDLAAIGGDVSCQVVNNKGCIISKRDNYKLEDGRPSSISWEPMIIVGMGTKDKNFSTQTEYMRFIGDTRPILEINPDYQIDTVIAPISKNTAYFLISGQYFQSENLYPNPDAKQEGGWGVRPQEGKQVMRFRLRVGNKCWNGSRWVVPEPNDRGSMFYVNVGNGDTTVWYTWNDFKNNVDYAYNLDREGYSIPIKTSDNLCGKVEFEILSPIPYDTIYNGRKAHYTFIKDLKLTIHTGIDNSDVKDSDVRYVNIINDNYVNDFSDIELKINTQTDKGFSFSSVLQNNGNNYIYNKELFNESLGKTQLQEYNLIEKYHGQYSTPKKILEATIEKIHPMSTVTESLLGSSFDIDSYTYDLLYDNYTAKLIEK